MTAAALPAGAATEPGTAAGEAADDGEGAGAGGGEKAGGEAVAEVVEGGGAAGVGVVEAGGVAGVGVVEAGGVAVAGVVEAGGAAVETRRSRPADSVGAAGSRFWDAAATDRASGGRDAVVVAPDGFSVCIGRGTGGTGGTKGTEGTEGAEGTAVLPIGSGGLVQTVIVGDTERRTSPAGTAAGTAAGGGRVCAVLRAGADGEPKFCDGLLVCAALAVGRDQARRITLAV